MIPHARNAHDHRIRSAAVTDPFALPTSPPPTAAAADPAAGDDAELRQLHPAVRWVWLAGAIIGFFVILVMSMIGESILVNAADDDWPLPWGVLSIPGSLLLGVWLIVFSQLRYAKWGYALRAQDVVIQGGVLWRVRRCVPRSRVQHVDITSGPLDRAFGLVSVHLFTAGAPGAVAAIPGLSPGAAEELRAALVRSSADGV
jgi:uncharacterized protein